MRSEDRRTLVAAQAAPHRLADVPNDTDVSPPKGTALRLGGAIDGTLKTLLAVALLGELGVVFFSIVAREVFGSPWLWANEVAEMALSTIAFVGGAFAYRRGEHAAIHTVIDALPLGARRACCALV